MFCSKHFLASSNEIQLCNIILFYPVHLTVISPPTIRPVQDGHCPPAFLGPHQLGDRRAAVAAEQRASPASIAARRPRAIRRPRPPRGGATRSGRGGVVPCRVHVGVGSPAVLGRVPGTDLASPLSAPCGSFSLVGSFVENGGVQSEHGRIPAATFASVLLPPPSLDSPRAFWTALSNDVPLVEHALLQLTQHPRLSILAPGNAGLFSVNPSSSFGPLLSLTDDSDNAAIGLLSEAAGPDLFLLRLFGFRRGGGGLSKGRKLRGVAELACLLVDVRRCRPKRSLLRLSPRRRQFHQLLLVLWTTRPRTRPSAGGAVIVRSVSAVLSVSSPSPHQYWPDIVKTSPSIGLEDSSDFRDRILRRNLPLLSRMTPRASSRCQPESKARGEEDKLEAQSGNN